MWTRAASLVAGARIPMARDGTCQMILISSIGPLNQVWAVWQYLMMMPRTMMETMILMMGPWTTW